MNLVLFTFSILITETFSDLCNYHATLVETETFYFSQPFTKNITLDLSNYINAFSQYSSLIPEFAEHLKVYSNHDLINKTEPKPLIPFSADLNFYKIEEDTLGSNAFNACSINGGALVAIDGQNRQQIANILKASGISKTPFYALPYHSLFSPLSLETFDTPSRDNLQQMWLKSPPYLTSENQILYPSSKIKITEGNERDSTLDDYKSPVLCTKENNPWDLPANRKNWLTIVPKIKSAISLLEKMKQSYDESAKTLKNLPKGIWKNTVDFFKMVLPEPMKATIDFLEVFSKRKNWEKTKGSTANKFYSFVKTALKLARQFDFHENSITRLPEAKPKFVPPSINELNWRDLFDLDEETYGFSGQVTITPLMSYSEEPHDINTIPVHFNALINARIYNRITDKMTLYDVKPNTANGEIAAIKTVIRGSKINIASPTEIKPLQCFSPETELYKVCHKLPYMASDFLPKSNLEKCANALVAQNFSTDFLECPKSSVSSGLRIYRADCDSDGHSTLVINSDKPLSLNFVCDSISTLSKTFSTFPSYAKTDCEVQIVGGSNSNLTLPQFNPDFLQNPTVGIINSHTTPIQSVQLTVTQIILISSFAPFGVLLAFALIVSIMYLIYKKCCNQPQPQPPQQQFILPQFFPAVQLNDFPMLN